MDGPSICPFKVGQSEGATKSRNTKSVSMRQTLRAFKGSERVESLQGGIFVGSDSASRVNLPGEWQKNAGEGFKAKRR